MKYKKILLIVMDSVGVGETPTSAKYGDEGANTVANIAKECGGLNVPNLEKLGLGNIIDITGVKKQDKPQAFITKLDEVSVGKDTMTGHWEMMGLEVSTPFQTFTDTGFPKELIDELEKATGRKIVGNKSSSGTVILDEFGEHQMKTGDLIVYTSADSVLQIAAHEDIISVDELYDICEKARAITMNDEWKVGRVIARPYVGEGVGKFTRTSNRHDYALKPFGKTVLDSLKDNGFDSIALGKINDIFDTEGVTKAIKTVSNEDGMEKLINLVDEDFNGLAFLNLVDFDALYGHRRNAEGYKQCIEDFDKQLGELLEKVSNDTLVMLTADHGTDPTHKGTDHTREYVPLIMYSKDMAEQNKLDIGKTFANIGATIAENFNVQVPSNLGSSYLNILR